MNMTPGTIYFRLFGIPVYIRPSSWVILALLGGGLHMSSAADLQGILIFMVVGMVVLLTHEFGHALVGRAVGGIPQLIVVEGMGAVTHSVPPRTRGGDFLMTLAGPLATLLPGILAGFAFALQVGINPVAGVVFALVAPLPFTPVPDWVVAQLYGSGLAEMPRFVLLLYINIFQVSVWWCLFNLLPILPLDGGHLLAHLCPSRRTVCTVGMVLSIAIAAWALTFGGIFLVILFGYWAYLNWRFMRGE